MVEPVGKIDRPEPRWQAVLALLAVGGIYVALPRALIVGPKWALPVFIVVLLTPTVVAHRTGKLSWNRTLGIVISSVITLALIASVGLLVAAVPSHKETPVELLSSGAELWLTNVLVFALWYWRLDGGGPHLREMGSHHTAGAFFFPQMMDGAPIENAKTWSPRFIDYVFLAFNTSTAFSPTDTPVLARWGKVLMMLQSIISLAILVLLAARAVNIL
jgi:hypothetical protein